MQTGTGQSTTLLVGLYWGAGMQKRRVEQQAYFSGVSEPIPRGVCNGESTSTVDRETTLLHLFLCLLSRLRRTPLKRASLSLHTTSTVELAMAFSPRRTMLGE